MPREHYQDLLHGLDEQVLEMGELVAGTIGACVDSLERHDVGAAQALIEADNEIDRKRYEVENGALLLIATQQPLAGDLRAVAAILTIATELERIGDYCEGIAKLTLRIAGDRPAGLKQPVEPPPPRIQAMANITQRLLRQVLIAFRDRDVAVAGRVWAADDEVDTLYEEIFRTLLAEMAEDRTKVQQGTYLLWVAHNLERMADRVTNIAERIAFVVTGDVAGFRTEQRAQMAQS